MNILVTNDDSHRSPLLSALIHFLHPFGTLHVVVPEFEQSWTGKSISRSNSIVAKRTEICGVPGYTVSGTPADCANLAIYSLLPKKPDLIVSGINVGLNTGRGFVLSSGTIGGCLEGAIAGIPGIAISQEIDADTWPAYRKDYSISAVTLKRFEQQYALILGEVFDIFLSSNREEFLSLPITWNINLPFTLATGARATLSALAKSSYTRLFKNTESKLINGDLEFTHKPDFFNAAAERDEDRGLILRGIPSITPLDIGVFGSFGAHSSAPRWSRLASLF